MPDRYRLKYFRPDLRRRLDDFRVRLSRPDAVLALSILGLIAGTFAAITIIALRLLVDYAQTIFYEMDNPGDFESLSFQMRFTISVIGGGLIGILFGLTTSSSHTVGLVHILERLAYHQGRLPKMNALIQFIGGAITMIAGHSVGREGPSAHLGAASSNLPAQALDLPNNSLRVLAACGAAAGIAASFNTPLAGAAFAMEVLLMEYTVAGFAPIILATVSATALTRLVFGNDLAYSVPSFSLGSLTELPFILICGIIIGLLAATFNFLFQWVSTQRTRLPEWFRPVLAGLLVGVCGVFSPEIMGMGDDTVNAILLGNPGISLLLIILFFKLIATTGGIGLGLPGGIVGPTLFIGAAAGGLLGSVGVLLGINEVDSVGLYAMIGMGAMMAGTMQAPLAGLIAILELTGEPNFILPGMLAVVAATIMSGHFGNNQSILQGLLKARGLDYKSDPFAQSLRKIGVAAVMSRKFSVLSPVIDPEQCDETLALEPTWIIIREGGKPDMLLKAVDLVRERKEAHEEETYALMEIPGERLETRYIDMRATMQEAKDKIENEGAQSLIVVSQTVPGITRAMGVITPDDIESSYRY